MCYLKYMEKKTHNVFKITNISLLFLFLSLSLSISLSIYPYVVIHLLTSEEVAGNTESA